MDTVWKASHSEGHEPPDGGPTSFVIAYRHRLFRKLDKILVLRDGQIVEQGNHDSLWQLRLLHELYQSQFNQ